MAPPKRPWFRLYTEALQDRKLRRLPPAQRWVWVAVLSLSCQSPERGWLLLAEGEPATLDDIADEAAVPKAQTAKAMDAFERMGMVARSEQGWNVTKWTARQYESDRSTDRVQRHRNASRNDDETLHGNGKERRSSRAPTTESEAENRAETSGEVSGAADAAPSKPKPRDELFEAIVEACGLDQSALTKTERGRANKATKELREVGATPDGVRARAEVYQRRWPTCELTPNALASNYSQLSNGKPPPGREHEALDRYDPSVWTARPSA